MNTLRDRARKLYQVASRYANEREAVDMIEALLIVTRAEGIEVGLDQYDKHGHMEKTA